MLVGSFLPVAISTRCTPTWLRRIIAPDQRKRTDRLGVTSNETSAQTRLRSRLGSWAMLYLLLRGRYSFEHTQIGVVSRAVL